MIDIVMHHCPFMPHDPSITRDKGQWYLHQEYDVPDTYETDVLSTEITHCPWCGKEL